MDTSDHLTHHGMPAAAAGSTDAQRYRDGCVAELAALIQVPTHPKVRGMLAYYRSIVPSDRLPGRAHFDPIDVPGLLPNVWLLEPEDARFHYRLMGTRVAAAFEADLTGRYVDEVHTKTGTAAMHAHLAGVVATRRPDYRRGRPNAWPINAFLTLERLYLPLARDGATVDMILGFTVFLKEDGREF
jgi:hypothetical protein